MTLAPLSEPWSVHRNQSTSCDQPTSLCNQAKRRIYAICSQDAQILRFAQEDNLLFGHRSHHRGRIGIAAIGYTASTRTMTDDHCGFTSAELRKLRSLKDPYGVQKFLDNMPYHLEDTAWSPRKVLAEQTSHCLEGAIFAAAALRVNGYPP